LSEAAEFRDSLSLTEVSSLRFKARLRHVSRTTGGSYLIFGKTLIEIRPFLWVESFWRDHS